MASNKGVQPQYHFHAMNKATDEKSRIGAAWDQPDGSISISIDPFITLTSHKDLVLRLFPNREAGKMKIRVNSEGRLEGDPGDDIPF